MTCNATGTLSIHRGDSISHISMSHTWHTQLTGLLSGTPLAISAPHGFHLLYKIATLSSFIQYNCSLDNSHQLTGAINDPYGANCLTFYHLYGYLVMCFPQPRSDNVYYFCAYRAVMVWLQETAYGVNFAYAPDVIKVPSLIGYQDSDVAPKQKRKKHKRHLLQVLASGLGHWQLHFTLTPTQCRQPTYERQYDGIHKKTTEAGWQTRLPAKDARFFVTDRAVLFPLPSTIHQIAQVESILSVDLLLAANHTSFPIQKNFKNL